MWLIRMSHISRLIMNQSVICIPISSVFYQESVFLVCQWTQQKWEKSILDFFGTAALSSMWKWLCQVVLCDVTKWAGTSPSSSQPGVASSDPLVPSKSCFFHRKQKPGVVWGFSFLICHFFLSFFFILKALFIFPLQNGNAVCSARRCPALSCPNPVHRPGDCCPR